MDKSAQGAMGGEESFINQKKMHCAKLLFCCPLLFSIIFNMIKFFITVITSNLPFSQWDSVFKDPMTTNAAIDRLVHHATVLELNTSSYRAECAKHKLEKTVKTPVKASNKQEVSSAVSRVIMREIFTTS